MFMCFSSITDVFNTVLIYYARWTTSILLIHHLLVAAKLSSWLLSNIELPGCPHLLRFDFLCVCELFNNLVEDYKYLQCSSLFPQISPSLYYFPNAFGQPPLEQLYTLFEQITGSIQPFFSQLPKHSSSISLLRLTHGIQGNTDFQSYFGVFAIN